MKKNSFFLNYGFDKGKLKPLISWFFRAYGESKTFEFLEKVKNLGFKNATQSGSSISLDDLATPPTKISLLSAAELQIKNIETQYKRGLITALEKFQQTIDIWQEMNETIKEEVIHHFSSTNILNPVYMMAFSGARGNISQVRQLVGMRGLMADPQGQLIDFPIRSNFREGLTLTEYVISCYGARKGLVDTALRTAKSGYLTRRLVDVSQHITISAWDCGTQRGIFLTNLEDEKSEKVISSLEQRLLGRVLYENVKTTLEDEKKQKVSSSLGERLFGRGLYENIKTNTIKERIRMKRESNSLLSFYKKYNIDPPKSVIDEDIDELLCKNEQISLPVAAFLVKEKKQVLVRSALTCQYTQSVCQLCYGWGLSSSNLVSLGEAVGVISGQSIGEPGTQLTMRTFHTGGVFSGELIELLRATHLGKIHFLNPLPGSMIRTPKGKIAFLTKAPGQLSLKPIFSSDQTTIFSLPAATLLFVKEGEKVIKGQPLAEFSKNDFQSNSNEEEDFINSEMEGKIYTKQGSGDSKTKTKLDLFQDSQPATLNKQAGISPKYISFWILFGKVLQHTSFFSESLINFGDLVDSSTKVGNFIKFTPYSNQNFEVLRKLKKINFSIHKSLQTTSHNSFLKSFHKQTISSFKEKPFEKDYDVFQMVKKKILLSPARDTKVATINYGDTSKNFDLSRKKNNFFSQRGGFFCKKNQKKRKIKTCFKTSSEKMIARNYTFDLILQKNIFTICFQDIQYYKFGYFFTFHVRNKKTKILLKNSLSQKFFFNSDFLKFLFLQLVEQGNPTKTSSLICSYKLYIKTSESKGYLFFFSEDWSFPSPQLKTIQTINNFKKKKNFRKIFYFSLKTKISRQGEFYYFPAPQNGLIYKSTFKKKKSFSPTLIFRNTRILKKNCKNKKNNILYVFLTNQNQQTKIAKKIFFLPSILEEFLYLSKIKIQIHLTNKTTTFRFYTFKKLMFMQNFVCERSHLERSHLLYFEKESLNFKKAIPQSKLFLIIKYFFDRFHFLKKKKNFHKTRQNFLRINTIWVPIKQKKYLKYKNIEFFENFYKLFCFTKASSFYPLFFQLYSFYTSFDSFDQLFKKKKMKKTEPLQKQIKRVFKLSSLTNFFIWYKGFSSFPRKNFDHEKTNFSNTFYSPKSGYKVKSFQDIGVKWSRSGFLAGNLVANPLFLKVEPLSFDTVKFVPPFSKNWVFNEIQNQLFQFTNSNTFSFLLCFLQKNFDKKKSFQTKKRTPSHQNGTENFQQSFLQIDLQNQEKIKKNQKKLLEKKGFLPFSLLPYKKKKIKNEKLLFQKYTCIAQKKEKLQRVFWSQRRFTSFADGFFCKKNQKKSKNINFHFFLKSFWTSFLHSSSIFQTKTKLNNFEIFLHIPSQLLDQKTFYEKNKNLSTVSASQKISYLKQDWRGYLNKKKGFCLKEKNKQKKNVNFTQLIQKKLEIWLYNDVFLQKVPRVKQIKKKFLFQQSVTQPWYHFFSFLRFQSSGFLSFSKLPSFQLFRNLTPTKNTKKKFLYSYFWVQKQLVESIKHIKKKKNTNFSTKADRKRVFDTSFFQNKLYKYKDLVYESKKINLYLQTLLYVNSLLELTTEKKTIVNSSVQKKIQCISSFSKQLEKKKKLKKKTHKADRNKRLVLTQKYFIPSYFPFFFQNKKKVKKIFPSFLKTKTRSFSQRRIPSGWIFFPKHQNEIIQNHKRFLRYGRKGIEKVAFDTDLILMEAFSFQNRNYSVSQKPKNQKSPILSFFVKTGVFSISTSLNVQFLQTSKNIDFFIYKKLQENLTSSYQLEKKNFCQTKFFLVKLRQTLFRHGQTMKNLAWTNSYSSFAIPTESLKFQFISLSTSRWNSNIQTQKDLLVSFPSLVKSFSILYSEIEKKGTLHLSRIHGIPFLNSTWCLFDSRKIENSIWILRHHISWFLGNFLKSSQIFLFRKPREFSLEKLDFLQSNLSSLLQNTNPSRPKQYVSILEQQEKPNYLSRIFIKVPNITQEQKNILKNIENLKIGQQLKNTTIIPFFKPLSLEVRVKKILSFKKSFKKYSQNDCTSQHTKKKYFFRLFAIFIIPKGFVFEKSCFVCQLDFGIVKKNEKNENHIQLNYKDFLSWTKKKKKQTVFSIQKNFLQSQYEKKNLFFLNVKSKNKNFFDYFNTTPTRIRQFAAIPFFKALIYQDFQQFQKKAPKIALVDFFSTKLEPFLVTSTFTPFVGEIFRNTQYSKHFLNFFYNEKKSPHRKTNPKPFFMVTEAEQLTLLLETKSSEVKVGNLVLNGQKVTQGRSFKEGGQIIEIDVEKIVLRRGQNFVNYAQSSIFIKPGETISQGWPIMTFSYQRSKTEDIVQGIPKIDQFFESRSLTEKNFLSLEIQKIDEENKKKYPNEQAVLKSYERIQLMIVENIQRIYLSQGVAISDKHIEIAVKQMTSAVFMYDENNDAGPYVPFFSNFSQIVREAKSLGPVLERTQARKFFFKRVQQNKNFVKHQKTLKGKKTNQNRIIDINKSMLKELQYKIQIQKESLFGGLNISLLRSTSHIHFFSLTNLTFLKKKQLSFQFYPKNQIFSFTIPIFNQFLLKEHLQNVTYFNKIRSYRKTQYYPILIKKHFSFIKNGAKTEKLVLKNGPLFPIYGTIKTKIIAKADLPFFYNEKSFFKNRLRYILPKPQPLESEIGTNKKTFFKISTYSTDKKPKWVYLPVLLGITQAALTSTSFLSAASFQQTTLVLSRSAAVGRVDFLRGIKERVILGERLFAGTGHPLSSLLTISLSREIKFFFPQLKKRKSKQLKNFTTNNNFFLTHQNVQCYNFRKIKMNTSEAGEPSQSDGMQMVPSLFGIRSKNEVLNTEILKLENKKNKENITDNKKFFQMFLKQIGSQKICNPALENWLQIFKKKMINPSIPSKETRSASTLKQIDSQKICNPALENLLQIFKKKSTNPSISRKETQSFYNLKKIRT